MTIPVADVMRKKIESTFAPSVLDIVDESHLHQGHSGHREGGESHFRVLIVSDAFEGASRVDRQRRVYAALADELAGPVHALALKTQTPGEADLL